MTIAHNARFALYASVALAAIAITPAMAQEAGGSEDGAIVVTARR
jgi:hypothetical protein